MKLLAERVARILCLIFAILFSILMVYEENHMIFLHELIIVLANIVGFISISIVIKMEEHGQK